MFKKIKTVLKNRRKAKYDFHHKRSIELFPSDRRKQEKSRKYMQKIDKKEQAKMEKSERKFYQKNPNASENDFIDSLIDESELQSPD